MSKGYCYIGVKECGCVVAAVVDNPEHKRYVAKDLAGFVRDGLTIERKPVEWVRENPFGCKCKPKQKAPLVPELRLKTDESQNAKR